MGLKKLLLEIQSKNYLYHFTTIRSLLWILSDNKLKRGKTNIAIKISGDSYEAIRREKEMEGDGYSNLKGVSLTRNRTLNWQEIAIVFDRQALKSHHKLYPLSVYGEHRAEDAFREEVSIKDINNISRYIEFIYLPRFKKKLIDRLIDIKEIRDDDIDIKVFHKGKFISIFKVLNNKWEYRELIR